jgi:hypothetical protein
LSDDKVEVMYFYSDAYENEKKLSNLSRKIIQERKDIQIQLINIDDPGNDELTELFGVDMVPVIIFLTSKGDIAAKRFQHLSEKNAVHEIADQINSGELPNPLVEEIKMKILESLKTVTKRSEITTLVVEQIENDLIESTMKSDIDELVNSHISAINHTIRDLQEYKKVLQKHSKRYNDFIV